MAEDRLRQRALQARRARVERELKKHSEIIVGVILTLLATLFLYLNEQYFKIEGLATLDSLGGKPTPLVDFPVGDEMQVHFIDVGQGDCSLILTEDTAVLIDCGEKSKMPDVYKYLMSMGITHLDYLICTHPHSDHIGGMAKLLDFFTTDCIIMPDIPGNMTVTTFSYTNLLKTAERKNIPIRLVYTTDEIKVKDSYTIDIIAPVNDYEEINNYSIVCRIKNGVHSFLFTGDIEKAAEEDIIRAGKDIRANVIKVPHHGSDTSSTEDFLYEVMPDYSVICCGEGNDYDHPHKEIMALYRGFGIDTYVTAFNGNIVFVSKDNKLSVVSEY